LSNASFSDDVSSFVIDFPEDYNTTKKPALDLNHGGIWKTKYAKITWEVVKCS